MFLNLIRFFLLSFLVLPLVGYAQSFTPRANEILRTVASADGFIDKDLHAEFWVEMSIFDKREMDDTIKFLNANMVMMHSYQRELWESALISYRSKRLVKTDILIDLEKKMPVALRQALPFPHGSPERLRNEAALNKTINTAMINSKNLLLAASKHSVFVGVNGEVVHLDEEKILHVFNSSNAIVNRFRKLLNRSWVD